MGSGVPRDKETGDKKCRGGRRRGRTKREEVSLPPQPVTSGADGAAASAVRSAASRPGFFIYFFPASPPSASCTLAEEPRSRGPCVQVWANYRDSHQG